MLIFLFTLTWPVQNKKKYQHIAPMAVSGAKKVTFILLFKMPTVYFTAFSFNWNYIFALDG